MPEDFAFVCLYKTPFLQNTYGGCFYHPRHQSDLVSRKHQYDDGNNNLLSKWFSLNAGKDFVKAATGGDL